jgi:ankyrin repeat protein
LVHRIILRLSPKSLIAELEENPMAVYITDASGRTALDWAAARGQDEDLALLLANKADPNTMDITGRTAMLNAADSESCGCLRLLLEAKGDPNPKAVKGVFRSSPLNAAVMRGRTDMLRTLLEFDADPNISNPEGLTPLHNVARFQNADCAMVLLEHGANLNALSKDGTTPLIASIVYNNHGVLQLFLDRCYEYMTSAQIQGKCLIPTHRNCVA